MTCMCRRAELGVTITWTVSTIILSLFLHTKHSSLMLSSELGHFGHKNWKNELKLATTDLLDGCDLRVMMWTTLSTILPSPDQMYCFLMARPPTRKLLAGCNAAMIADARPRPPQTAEKSTSTLKIFEALARSECHSSSGVLEVQGPHGGQ